MTATIALERMVEVTSDLQLAEVPAASLKRAAHIIADTVGVSVAGSRQPEMRALLQIEAQRGVVGQSSAGATVLGRLPARADPEQAAFLNGTAGSFIELDEGIRPTGHPGMQVVPAALAVAEEVHASGESFLRAVVAGYEVTARLFTAFRLPFPVHPHGHLGAIGAAVAVALLRGRDPMQPAKIAATSPILSVWDACYEGGTARNTWMGDACRLGIRSSRLADAGFTGSFEALEASFGKVAGVLEHEDVLSGPLDYDNLGVTRNYFKRHSACALSHAAVDAVAKMPDLRHAEISSILVETVTNHLKLDRQARPNNLSARFSLQYIVAAAVLGRKLEADAFNYDPEVARLAQRVEVRAVPELEKNWPDIAPARVTVVTASGTQRAQVDNPHGHFLDPFTEDEVQAKFTHLVDNAAVSQALWPAFMGLAQVDDCASLFRHLEP